MRLLLVLGLLPALVHAEPVTHAFLATGGETYIADGAGKVTWKYPHPSRDGWVLANGNVLLALSKSKDVPRRGGRRGGPGTARWSSSSRARSPR